MLHYSEQWSTVVILLAVILFAVGPSALGLFIVRRLWSAADLRRDHDVVGFAVSVVGVIYGVMLGFVLSAIWGEYTHTDEVATLEAVSLRNLHRNSYALPVTNQVAIRTALIAHAHAVVEDEWKTLRKQQESTLAQETMEQLWRSYYTVQPETEAQKIWLAESVSTLNEMAKLRRVRILASEQTVSGVMWVLLVLGGVTTCGFMHAFGVERFRSHLLMTASVAVLILLVLYLIYSLDNPFGGEPHLMPKAFLRFLAAHPTPE